MKIFETLFGIKESNVKTTCILLPIITKGLLTGFNIGNFFRGRLYSSYNARNFTIIHTGIGPGFAGDAVLYLAEAGCKNIILFGSCGLLPLTLSLSPKGRGKKIGTVVTPVKCLAMESFTNMLLRKPVTNISYPDNTLIKAFMKNNASLVKRVNCATVGSLKLEQENILLFNKKAVDVVDMECSSVFSAAQYTGIKAMALLYVTDIINEKPFYKGLSPEDNSCLCNSIKQSAGILCEFITSLNE